MPLESSRLVPFLTKWFPWQLARPGVGAPRTGFHPPCTNTSREGGPQECKPLLFTGEHYHDPPNQPDSSAMLRLLAFCLVAATGITACAIPPLAPAKDTTTLIHCTNPRPQICTMDYAPVCALRDAGAGCTATPCPSGEWTQYPNACSACADQRVQGYVKGECPQSKKP